MTITTKDTTAAVGRVLLATLFLLSGLAKLTGPAATIAYIESSGMPFPKLAYLAALGVELGLASLLVLGVRTRLVAVVMAVFTVVTAVMFHNSLGDQGQFVNFFKNISIAGGLLQIAAFGAGQLSVDALLERRRAFTLAH
jgi:putative oxidoreductase